MVVIDGIGFRTQMAPGAGALCHGPDLGIDRIHSRPMSAQNKNFMAAAFALCLVACSLVAPKFNRPNISVVSIELRSGNLWQQNFAVKLNIQNPNARALPVSGLHVELHAGGVEVASGVSDHPFIVPPLGESEFDMTIKANLALAVLKLSQKLDQHAESVDYDLTGAASVELPFLHELPFHQMGTFSLNGIQ
jgi:LEA14-like dessication related protein